MSNVTVFDPDNVCQVFRSAPPVDQTALVASLQTQVTSLQSQLMTVTAARDAALAKVAIAIADAQARKDADAARVEGQNILDALA